VDKKCGFILNRFSKFYIKKSLFLPCPFEKLSTGVCFLIKNEAQNRENYLGKENFTAVPVVNPN
jgi:hypothetical protein